MIGEKAARMALQAAARAGTARPLLRKGRKRESIHASLEFIWEISADIS
jgi:hypothetical protein